MVERGELGRNQPPLRDIQIRQAGTSVGRKITISCRGGRPRLPDGAQLRRKRPRSHCQPGRGRPGLHEHVWGGRPRPPLFVHCHLKRSSAIRSSDGGTQSRNPSTSLRAGSALGRSREAGFSTSQNCPRADNLAPLEMTEEVEVSLFAQYSEEITCYFYPGLTILYAMCVRAHD